MDNLKKVTINGVVEEYPEGTLLVDIAKKWQHTEKYDIVLAIRNNRLCELSNEITDDCEIEFITATDKSGLQTYKRSLTLLMLKSFYSVMGRDKVERIYVDFSISNGYYCKVTSDVVLTEELLARVEKKMREIIAEDAPITKRTLNTSDAAELYSKHGMHDKAKLFKFRRNSKANLYTLKGFEDYYYGYMVPSAGYLKYFKLHLFDEGFVLGMPKRRNPDIVPDFVPQQKLFKVLQESTSWSELLEVDTVGDLNEQITKGNIKDIMLVQEALQESKLSHLANKIVENRDKKFIMIAGPSSSGKTTFSHRLAIQLKAHGLKPHPIPVDDYFVNRIDTPLDEEGKPDFETLEAIDVKRFNEDMSALARGERVEMPTYNFITGKREYKGNYLQLGKGDILIIEGIHCLNDELSASLPMESKFKIYISALTQLNIDEHNRISTTDCRLIRRMIRDARTRGSSAENTIEMWNSVRRGEDKYIFPYQESADVMFNSALVYELSVLKQYAEPLLFGISPDSPSYLEAKRLLKFLDYFLGVDSEDVPKNSLLREFLGGSTFHN